MQTGEKKFLSANWFPFLTAVLLSVIGTLFIYSACSIRADKAVQTLHISHIRFLLVGLVLVPAAAWINYRFVLRWSWLFYLITIGLLISVLLFGTSTMGAKRWVFGIQPSELAKIAVVLVLAQFLGKARRFRDFRGLLIAGLIAGIPTVLILIQPDLGTALALVPTVLAMLFTANVSPKLFWTLILTGLLAVSFELGAIYLVERGNFTPERQEQVIRMTGLRPHQIKRIHVFLFPDKDPRGSGYNKRQSEIAVGSGGLWGKGWCRGNQNLLGYLPPSVSANDFIFPVLAEELGFAGSVLILILFLGGILIPGVWIGCRCQDDSGKILVSGITTLLFCHVFINISMTVGLVPITGIPLPFISYGGTFMLSMMMMIGLLESVSLHGEQQEDLFTAD